MFPHWSHFAPLACALSAALSAATPAVVAPRAPGALEFNRDIRPILSENCFYCHGQDETHREAKLRLDRRESATAVRDEIAAIVPGKPEESELIRRIMATDPNDVMPPPESHKSLTPAQVALLRQWVAEGAEYQGHWAFIPPRRVEIGRMEGRRDGKALGGSTPGSASLASNALHPIDGFVRARLAKEGLAPSPEAPPGIWLRRASLDLTGLPPTPAELERFEADAARAGEAAYGAAVDRLLASPHFGERQAMDWLDAARYADTHGFNNDTSRSMWRWRDWVIDAFNANMPYDRFITEQLAGDLLPQPTIEQRIATAFNRNHVISSEGGIINEEYRVEYVADRVRTVSTAWLGLTMECARCHDHKFDPIEQRDYYRLFAFFNNVPEHGEDGRVANAVPMMPAPTREQQAVLEKQEKEIAALDARLDAARAKWVWRAEDRGRVAALVKAALAAAKAEKETVMLLEESEAAGEKEPKTPVRAEDKADGEKTAETILDAPAPARAIAKGKGRKVPGTMLDFGSKEGVTVAFWLRTEEDNARDVPLLSASDYSGSLAGVSFGRGRELRLIDGEVELRICDRYPVYALIVRSVDARIRNGESRHIAVTYTGGRKAAGVRIFVDGVEMATHVRHDGLNGDGGKRDFLIGADNGRGSATLCGKIEDARGWPRVVSENGVRAVFRARGLARALAQLESGTANERERTWVREALLAEKDAADEGFAERERLFAEQLALRRSLPTVMVMEEMAQPRPAFVLNRGQYDAHGEPVEAGVPETLLGAWPEGAPRNRLGLARWFTDPQHPLTARVVVNRFWAQLFGTGIVKTLEDFGSQSEWPSHPELLDWLAREFIDGGWNVKALFKTMVLSATYRQSSAVSPELLARDPENRLLARGPRVRLPAELIRDQALAVSGLLTPRIGGPSVYPYQPDKLYKGVVVDAPYPGTTWGESSDSDRYRRSLYTFWKRTLPHPAMTTFDAPDREFCTVRRSRTNTPLQALVLWNEPGYVEAARRLGTRMLRDAPGDDAARVAWAFRAATGRKPQAEELAVLLRSWGTLRADFGRNPEDATALLGVGASAVDGSIPPVELAAAASVAHMILSLDETITKH